MAWLKTLVRHFGSAEFLRFVLCGAITTCVDFVIYWTLKDTLGILWGKALSFTVAAALSFYLNKKITFGDKSRIGSGLIARYIGSQAANMATNVLINYILFRLTDVYWFAFVMAVGAAMAVNFTLQRLWVFKKGGDSA